MNLLEIRNLRSSIRTPDGTASALDGVDLTIKEGESVGLVGESGSGKSVLALSVLGLLPEPGGTIKDGSSIRFRGEELVGAPGKRLRAVRGGGIAMVFQEPMTALNPVLKVGSQIRESLLSHRALSRREARAEAGRLLSEVGIPAPEDALDSYPHQLSGGMRQRAMIAMALAGEPSLLIADEPTTALDVTTQVQVLDLLKDIQERRGMALLLISHDPRVVSRACNRVVVLYAGRVIEVGSMRDVLRDPLHPYSAGLLDSRLSLRRRRRELTPIPGEVPDATRWPPGCRFHPRCPQVMGRCRTEEPPLFQGPNQPQPEEPEAGAMVGRQGREKDRSAEPAPRRTRCWLASDDGPDGEVP